MQREVILQKSRNTNSRAFVGPGDYGRATGRGEREAGGAGERA